MQQKSNTNINPSWPSSNPGTHTVQDLMGTPISTSFAGFFYRADIWLDKNLNPVAKNLLMEIYLLEQRPLGCIASNTHLAKTLNIGKRTVERYVADLLESGHLQLVTFNGHHRKLKVNLNRLEPRQIGEEGRQIVPEPRQNGEPTSPKWRQSSIRKNNQLEESVEIDCASNKKTFSPTKKEGAKTPTKTQKRKTQKKKAKQQPEEEQKEQVLKFPFESEVFKKKWQEWIEYREELKIPYKTQRAIRQVFTRLAKFQEAFVIELIEESISNEWRGLIFRKTKEQYRKWLEQQQAQAQQTSKTGTGTRAKPKRDLIAHTQASNAVFRQIKTLEQQQESFQNYSLPKLEDLSTKLRDLWREAKTLEMHGSEIVRINSLGQVVADLIREKQQTTTIKH